MEERIAYVNGEFVPESKALISVFDRGFKWGDAVYDVESTFRGKIFKLEQHMDRLYSTLRYTRIDPGLTKEEMARITMEVVEPNVKLLGENEDYLVTQTVSRGVSTPSRKITGLRATVVVYCQLIGFNEFARFYMQGVPLVTPSIRRTPSQCVSPRAKICNKMNHMLAEFEAKLVDPHAYSLMLDLDGHITENASGNFMFVSKGRLMVPDRSRVLPGISMETVLELADDLGVPIVEGNFTPHDVYNSEEGFLTTSSYCILPVSSLNGIRLGAEVPGPVTRSLFKAWSDLVGVDLIERGLSHLQAEEREALLASR